MTVDHSFENAARWPVLLFVLFAGLKLGGCLLLPWWAVATPIWVPVVVLWLVALTALGVGEALAIWHRQGFTRYARSAKRKGIV